MSTSHISGPLVVGTDPRPAASTTVLTQRVVIAAAASIQGALLTSGALVPTGGYRFAAGNNKLLAMGTYRGTGTAAATPIVTGLTTINQLVMFRFRHGYSTATSLTRNVPYPARAAGTPGSFYPLVVRTGATNKEHFFGIGTAATFGYFAMGV